MEGSKAMGEPRVLGSLIREVREPELPYPSKPLKLRRVDERDRQPAFRRVRVHADDVVDRVAVDTFRQIEFLLIGLSVIMVRDGPGGKQAARKAR
jgi:hypothetical protein